MTGSPLYRDYVVPDTTHDGINLRVWAGTPWIVSAFTGRLSNDRSRAIIQWCHDRHGDEAFPFGDAPREGRWHRGSATVNGWTWMGFATEADMREFEAAWPSPAEGAPA